MFFKSIFFKNPDNHYIRALFLCWSLKTHRKVRQPQHQLLTKRFCCIWQACYKDHTCHEHCRYFLSLFYHCLPPFFFRCYPNYYMLCKLCFLHILNVLNDSKWIKKEADVFACLLKSILLSNHINFLLIIRSCCRYKIEISIIIIISTTLYVYKRRVIFRC